MNWSGPSSGGWDNLTNSEYFGRVMGYSMVGGVSAELRGGEFSDGFRTSFYTASARAIYNMSTRGIGVDGKSDVDPMPGKGSVAKCPGVPFYKLSDSNLGLQNSFGFWAGEHGSAMAAVNVIPVMNAMSGMHDVWGQWLQNQGYWNDVTNFGTMIPATALTYMAAASGPTAIMIEERRRGYYDF